MVFDGRQSGHPDAKLIYPYVCHPSAPLTGFAFGQILEIAYFCAHNSASPVIDTYYPVAWRSQNAFKSRMLILSLSFVRVAEGFRYIPNEATHLVCESTFTVFDAVQEASAFHRVCTSIGGVVNGATVETYISVETGALGQGFSTLDSDIQSEIGRGRYSPYGPREQTFTVKCELALTAGQAGRHDTEIYVESYAIDRAGSNALSYFPQQYTVWWEAR